MGRILLSICAVVVAGGLIGLTQQPDPPSQSARTQQGSTSNQSAPPDRPEPVAADRATEGEVAKPPETDEQNNAADDLKAQQRMAGWAIWVGIFTGAQVLVGTAGVMAVLMTLRQGHAALDKAREANNIARESAEQQLRAYVGFKGATLTKARSGYILSVAIKNSGQTPAYGLRYRVSQCAEICGAGTPKEKFHFKNAASGGPGMYLGPGGGFRMRVGPQNLDDRGLQMIRDGKIHLMLGGVVSYRDVFGRLRRSTFKSFIDMEIYDNGEEGIPSCVRGNNAN